VSALDPLTFVAVALLLVSVALLACYVVGDREKVKFSERAPAFNH